MEGGGQSSLTEIPRFLITIVRSRAKVSRKVWCQQLARQTQGSEDGGYSENNPVAQLDRRESEMADKVLGNLTAREIYEQSQGSPDNAHRTVRRLGTQQLQ